MARKSKNSIFGGMAKAASSSSRSPFISRPGTVLARVDRVSAGLNRSDEPYFHLEITVLAKIADGALPDEIQKMNRAASAAGAHDKIVPSGAHEKGERLSWRVRVHGEWKGIHLGNIKNAVEALLESLGVEGFQDYDDEEWEDAIFGQDGIAGEDQPAAGLLLVATTDARVSRKGSVFTATTWSAGDDVAMDLVEAGTLTAKEADLPEE